MAVSEIAGANIRAMLVATTLLLTNSGNSSLSIPASVAWSPRKLFAFASHSALSAPKTTSASGSALFNSSALAGSAIWTSLPCDAICLISAAVYLAGPTTDAAVAATIRTRLGGGSKTAILSEASRTGAAGAAAAAAMNNRRDTERSGTIFSFSAHGARLQLILHCFPAKFKAHLIGDGTFAKVRSSTLGTVSGGILGAVRGLLFLTLSDIIRRKRQCYVLVSTKARW